MSLLDIATDYLTFATVAFFLVIVLAKNDILFYALGVPVALVYGFTVASEQAIYSPLWVTGVAIGIMGLYFLGKVVLNTLSAISSRRNRNV